jgi:hypothetical protein
LRPAVRTPWPERSQDLLASLAAPVGPHSQLATLQSRSILLLLSSIASYSYLGVSGFLSPFGSRFMPHLGHLPGLSCTTSACIGQVYFWPAALAVAVGDGAGLVCAKAAIDVAKIAAQTNSVNFLMMFLPG